MTGALRSVCFVNEAWIGDPKAVTTGPMVQIYLLGRELARAGWEVSHVCGTRGAIPPGGSLMEEGMTVRLVPMPRFGPLAAAAAFRQEMEESAPAVCYQRGRSPLTGIVSDFCRRRGAAFVWAASGETGVRRGKYVREFLAKRTGLRRFLLRPWCMYLDRLCERGIMGADRLLVQTPTQMQTLFEQFGREGELFPSGHPVPGEGVLEKPSPPQVLWVGSIKKGKRPELFCELARRLEAEEAEFVVAGAATEERLGELIRRQAERQENFRWLGEVPFGQTPRLFAGAALLVNTTAPGLEGLPNTYLQAWLHGVPVVSLAADPGGVLREGRLGSVHPDLDSLAAEVRDLVVQPRRLREMGRRARDYAVERYAVEQVAARLAEVLLSAGGRDA